MTLRVLHTSRKQMYTILYLNNTKSITIIYVAKSIMIYVLLKIMMNEISVIVSLTVRLYYVNNNYMLYYLFHILEIIF